MFLKLLGNCLRYRKQYMQPDMFITSFKLHSYFQKLGSCAAKQVDGWVRFAIQSKVKELDLYMEGYCFPQFGFTASSLTQLKFHGLKFEVPSLLTLSSLTQLKLHGLELEAPFLAKFPTLKVLSLVGLKSDYESFQNLIFGYPIIEDLRLDLLYEIHSPMVRYPKLDISSIDFAVKLKTLKNLSLSSMKFTNQWLEGQISGLPLLERFTLSYWYIVENISIHSHSVKYLSISESFYFGSHISDIKTTFRTPNLIYLYLRSHAKLVISIEAPNLFQANLRLDIDQSASYFDLVHFLSNLRGLKKLMLSIGNEQDMIFPEDIRNILSPPLPNLKHLDATIYGDCKRNSELQDFLVWCAPSVETLKIQRKSYFLWG